MLAISPIPRNKRNLLTCEANDSQPPSSIVGSTVNSIIALVSDCRICSGGVNASSLHKSSAKARSVVISIDHVLSYRFSKGYRLYWHMVKNFLSREEVKYFKLEWQCSNCREFSIAWLKDSMNRGLLVSYFQTFLSNWEEVQKYYKGDAVMNNRSMVERITSHCCSLSEVLLNFQMPIRHDAPIAQPAQIPSSISSSNCSTFATYRSKSRNSYSKLPEEENCNDQHASLVGTVDIPENFIEKQPPLEDELSSLSLKAVEHLFGQMVSRDQENIPIDSINQNQKLDDRMNDEKDFDSNADQPKNTIFFAQNPFDAALQKSLSNVKVQVQAELDESQLNFPAEPILLESVEPVPFGEVQLDAGEIIGLSLNVFINENEKFLRFYQVYSAFATGYPEQRFFVVTSHSLYILSLKIHVNGRKSYVINVYLPYDKLSYVEIAADFEIISFVMVKGFRSFENDSIYTFEVCTACSHLSHCIVNEVLRAHDQYSCHKSLPLTIITKGTHRELLLQSFFSKELQDDDDLLSVYHSLWQQTNLDGTNMSDIVQSGYLYHKTLTNYVWFRRSADFQSSFFHLQNQKLYQFSDSTCKFGERVIPIFESVKSVSQISGVEESAYTFQIELHTREVIYFICNSGFELNKWVSLINLVLSSNGVIDHPVASLTVFTKTILYIVQEGMNHSVDGFMRLLDYFELSNVKSATGVYLSERYACIINDGSKLNWFIVRSSSQVDRMLSSLRLAGVANIELEEDCSSRFSSILNSMSNSYDFFHFSDQHADDAFEVVNNA